MVWFICIFIRGVNPTDIKAGYVLTTALIPTFYSLRHSSTQLVTRLSRLSICASQHPPSPFVPPEFLLLYPMVASTRTKNKSAHPAAPIMTEAAKQKAGIKTKRHAKKVTKDETIRELQAQLAALRNPGEESFSKEPLVRIFR